MNRRKEGAYYENLVAEYLKTQGYEILEKNYRYRLRIRYYRLWIDFMNSINNGGM